jgi:hypothetical protein
VSRTIYLIGGIGNVLFQLFEGYKLAGEVKYSTYFIQRNIITRYFLRWTIHENDMLPAIENFRSISEAPPMSILMKLLVLRFKNSTAFSGRGVEIENHLFGYYQDLRVDSSTHDFNLFVNHLRSCISYPHLSEKYNNVLHIRLGDSVWAKGKHSYYLKAFTLLNKYGIVTIVTDEAEAVKIFLEQSAIEVKNYEILSISTLETFTVMVHAKYLGVAPSTFSWWASQISLKAELIMENEMFHKFGSNKPVKWLL